MNYQKPIAMLAVVAMLSGCASKIDSGQLDYDNGTAYQHGSNEPFTGIAHFNDPPSVAEQVVLTLHDPTALYANMVRVLMDNCDVAFKNGALEGHVACFQRNGGKTLSFDLHNGRLDGESIEYNQDGGKSFDFNWSDGAMQGDQEVYSRDGRYVVHEWHVENGHKRGKEVRRYSDGDELAEGKWSDEGKFTGTMYVPDASAVYTLKDGVKEGDFKQLDAEEQNLKRVVVEGNYSNGQREGAWTFHGREAMNHAEQFEFNTRGTGLSKLMGVPQGDTATVTWKVGALSGPVKIFDKDQHVLLSFNVVDGEVTAPIERTDPQSGKTFTITDATILAALNYRPDGENPYLLATMGSGTAGPGGQAAEQQAMDAITQQQHAREARVAYVLDPIHNPDPTKAAAAQVPAPSQLPSASPAASMSVPAASGTQASDPATAAAPVPAQAAQATQPATTAPAMVAQAAVPPSPSVPSLCMADEHTVWTGRKGPKIFSLCASANLGPTTGYMQYRAGTVGDIQFKYPATLESPHGIFSYSEAAHSAEIDFSNGGYSYSISEQADGSETNITITLPSGKVSVINLDKASDTIDVNSTMDQFQKLGLSQ